MYVFYKLVQVLLFPGVWVAAGMAGALFLSRGGDKSGHPGLARLVLALTLVVFLATTTRPLSRLMVKPLESDYPPVDPAKMAKQEAIVVLSGGAHFQPGSHAATVMTSPSMDRLVEGVILWRAGVAPYLVISGGVGDPLRGTPTEADAMREVAMALGVPTEALAVETESRTTAENARGVRKQFPPLKRIALVTSASHLARSEELFKAQGFEVTPVPAGHLANGDGWTIESFVPRATSLRDSEAALHEEIGMIAARFQH